ncbi:diguanylate cyclase/phosphodiesterase [Rhizobium subbaraonis]|uniref:Diguanylate cyclase/phosphodiesterase n=1 Tax=Rhizobium subbaraonis TaxID=908946 RepID=A0A285UYQ3_9HYPH|nr:EAL domain-containing protein [Rhizobium subbaraonis]SOC45866.1 diguanylate cyclase/phosphodiesterase [Rhizobium subbaraonis]
MRIRSVESRFIAIVFGALVALVAPLFLLLFVLSSDRVARERLQDTEILLKANVQALGKPLWDLDDDSTQQIVKALQADDEIGYVHVRDTSGTLDIRRPASPPPVGSVQSKITADILHQAREGIRKVGEAEIWIAKRGAMSRITRDEIALFLIFLFSVGTLVVAAIIGNRMTIIRPLERLTAAIEATRRLGSRRHVEWTSSDEMGHLARTFNEMQSRLEREENELRLAHARTTEIYNKTPAMLFTIDPDNRIAAVSDYWLVATGYSRDAVIGRSFTEFVDAADHLVYRDRRSGGVDDNGICEVTVRFHRADGSVMDVLVLESCASIGSTEPTLSVMTDVTGLKEAESRNHRQAITDHLTGLLNRQGFESVLGSLITKADAEEQQLACLFLDLDRFKWINDNLGHAIGDQVLVEVAERLRNQLRFNDIVARLGGDEFAILLTAQDAIQLALDVSGRLCSALKEPIIINGSRLNVSASVGVAVYPDHAANAGDLLQKSDMAMYARKRNGKNGTRLFDDEIVDIARKRLEIEQCIEQALREDWLDAHLQPIIDLRSGRVSGFEALLRLRHPQKGLLVPEDIIVVAEENGSIGKVGDVIFEKSVRYLADLSKIDGFSDSYLAVNFSPLQFDAALPSRLASLLLQYGVKPSRIVVEITEAVLMLDNPAVRQVMDALGALGCRIALDDFGTGYSSLSYLNSFPVDIVKVDQSFVRALGTSAPEVARKSRTLIEGICMIAHQMGCTVVAEGVETEHQLQVLNEIGIDFGQGYHFSAPLPVASLIERLRGPAWDKPAIRAGER